MCHLQCERVRGVVSCGTLGCFARFVDRRARAKPDEGMVERRNTRGKGKGGKEGGRKKGGGKARNYKGRDPESMLTDAVESVQGERKNMSTDLMHMASPGCA